MLVALFALALAALVLAQSPSDSLSPSQPSADVEPSPSDLSPVRLVSLSPFDRNRILVNAANSRTVPYM